MLWDVAKRHLETQWLLVKGDVARSLLFTPNAGTLLAALGPADTRQRRAGEIVLWDVSTRTVRAKLLGHARAVTSLALADQGRILISGSADTTIRFWDLVSQREYAMLKGHRAAIGFESLAVALSPDESCFASISYDHTVRLWRLARKQHRSTPQ